MSLVFNMVGGGGDGGLLPTDAILRVQAPAGSTVTITKGAATKTDLGHENANNPSIYDYYFIIHASQFDSTAWTVTATLGSDSATKTIVINAADEYDLAFYAFLPSGYTPVQYIESTGTQYINLAIGKTVNINAIKILADLTVEGGATSSAFMGNIDATPYFAFVRLYSHTQIEPTLNSDGSTTGVYDTTLFHRRVSYGYEGSNGTITISKNGETWYTGSRGTRNLSAVPLFSLYSYRMNAKLFGFKFYDTDHTTLLRDLYPCYRNSDSVVGLYDKVSETFLTNAGTGTFIVGGDL